MGLVAGSNQKLPKGSTGATHAACSSSSEWTGGVTQSIILGLDFGEGGRIGRKAASLLRTRTLGVLVDCMRFDGWKSIARPCG
jgi:hypothetical protein